MRDTWLCEECAINPLAWEPEWCARCGVPAPSINCRCDQLPTVIDAARSVGWHEGWLRNSVRLLKYSDERARAVPLGRLMAERTRDLECHDLIVPVPLHDRRERERGFNQSVELASAISHETGLALSTSTIERAINTPPQVGLARSMRQQNVRGAFALKDARAVHGASILVVDDVFTTGATLAEVAQVLKHGGVRRVDVVTVTRAPMHAFHGAEIVGVDA
jgi:ComF family protein